jgi:hypothetical protein
VVVGVSKASVSSSATEVERLEPPRLASRLHALQIEEIVDELPSRIALVDDAEELPLWACRRARASIGEAPEAGQRGPQLVADGRDEGVLETLDFLPLRDVDLHADEAGDAAGAVADRRDRQKVPERVLSRR